jgi:hypothetical protein
MLSYTILLYISIFSLIVPIGTGFYRIKQISADIKILLFWLVIAFITAVGYMWLIKDKNVHQVIEYVSILIEYVCMMVVIYSWQESGHIKRFFLILLLGYIVFWAGAWVIFRHTEVLLSITSSVYQTILALCAGYTLFVVISSYTGSLFRYQRFWILLALVLNYTGTLLPVTLVIVLFDKPENAAFLIWSITWVFIILSNILFTIGFLCPQTQRQ